MPDDHVPTREIVDFDDQGNPRPGPASYGEAGPMPLEFVCRVADRIGYEQQRANDERRPLSTYGLAKALWEAGFLADPGAVATPTPIDAEIAGAWSKSTPNPDGEEKGHV